MGDYTARPGRAGQTPYRKYVMKKITIIFSLTDDSLATVVFPSRLETFTAKIEFGAYVILDGMGEVIATAGRFQNLPGQLVKYFTDKGFSVVLPPF